MRVTLAIILTDDAGRICPVAQISDQQFLINVAHLAILNARADATVLEVIDAGLATQASESAEALEKKLVAIVSGLAEVLNAPPVPPAKVESPPIPEVENSERLN